MVGNLDGYDTVWFHIKGITNILSIHNVTETFHVQFGSKTDNYFVVCREDGSPRYFTSGTRNLYYYDMLVVNGTVLAMDGDDDNEDDKVVNDPSHVKTVKDKMSGFTQRQIKSAVIARKF